MAAQQNFRTAFNGFNREDVVHYIEYLNAKHTAEINQLNSELEFLRSKLNHEVPEIPEPEAPISFQDAQIQDLTDRCDAQEAELVTLRAEKEQLEARLNEAMAAGSEMEGMLNDAIAQKDQLAAQLETALQQRNSYESRADEELQAYRRAERAERLARERAEQMYRQANGVIADATAKVDEAAAQIGQLSGSVMEQLAQLQQAVSGSNNALKDAAAAMYAIRPETEE